MTVPADEYPPPPVLQPPAIVTPQPGSRLEQLLGMLEAARAAAEEAQARYDAIDKGIKYEVAALFPDRPVIGIAGGPGRPALVMRWHPGQWYAPVAMLRDKHPGVWDELKVQKRGWWGLHAQEGS
jgi:hypothetical protein